MQTNNTLEQVTIRLVKEKMLYSDHAIISPEDAINVVADAICEYDREVLCVVNLNNAGKPINLNIASIGNAYQTIADPSQVFKTSILSNASRIILLHNHPGNELRPSEMDIQMTDRMMQAGELLGIPVLDHVIIGTENTKYFSFREKQVIDCSLKNEYAKKLMDIDLKQDIIRDIKKNGYNPTPRLLDNIDALNDIQKEKKEIKSLKDLKEYGNILKQEKQIYNAAVKECQRQEMLKKPIIAR